jgi:hypothetical protein
MGKLLRRSTKISALTESDTYPATLEASSTEVNHDDIIATGILTALSPFFDKGDSTSNMLAKMLERLLKKASHDDLVNVIVSATKFANDMAPFLEGEANEIATDSPDPGRYDSDSIIDGNGPGPSDWSDTVREINVDETRNAELSETLSEEMSDLASGYQTPVERDQGSDGAASEVSVS